MKLYPLKFQPIFKERLWGGSKLSTVLDKSTDRDNIGESWELSGVEGDVSVLANGPLAGMSLNELIQKFGEELLGGRVLDQFGEEFPILIKFIDAEKDLSIQLHPNNALAKKRHNSFGKTEMWYIMDADPGANLIIGFNRDVSKEEYQRKLKNSSLLDLLHYESVQVGDTFFINTGKIHAIGAGVLLAEIQQTSDITYRVYDFDRRDKDGKLRELHTDLALDAIDYQKKDDFRVQYPKKINVVNPMVNSPYFITNFLEFSKDHEQDLASRDAFSIYMCVEGKLLLHNSEGTVALQRGETALVSASTSWLRFETQRAKLLEVTI